MRWSLRIGRIAGIDVFVHWTFLILIGWMFVAHLGRGQGVMEALRGVGFLLALFGCVVLHELGHALTARRYQILTKDITLFPIGGVARLERMPRDPSQEFWVAIAGPAVNVAIALLIGAGLWLLGGGFVLPEALVSDERFWERLLVVNLFLVAFNLLPAFPMDGGRILRALLAKQMEYVRATRIAARVGQGMAILFCLLGLLAPQPFLVFIALFVFVGAQEEAQMTVMTTTLSGLKVGEATITKFQVLSTADTLEKAVAELLTGSQQDFPVLEEGRVVGMLTRTNLVQSLAQSGRQRPVREVMTPQVQFVDEGEMVEKAYELLREHQCSTLPVLRDGRLVGIITLENIAEWLMVHSALHDKARPARSPKPPT